MFLSKVFANLIFQSLVTYGFAKATIEDPKMSKAVAENALTYMVAVRKGHSVLLVSDRTFLESDFHYY